jgi:hypothetical protein
MSGGFTPTLKRVSDNVHFEAEFLASEHGMVKRSGITVAASTVSADADGDKVVRKGTFLTKITSGPEIGKYGEYDPQVNERVMIVETGAGLTSYTLTWGGQTTASIAEAATAAQVQAALVALSNVAPGDVVVTAVGSPDSLAGGFFIEFTGVNVDTDVGAITATPTGGTGGVDINVEQAGEGTPTDGRQTPSDNDSGYLPESINCEDGDVICGLLIHGSVLSARVHPAPDATTKAAVKGRITYQ